MRPLTPLCDLAIKYQTDKGGRHFTYGGQYSEHCHEYTPLYWDILNGRRYEITRVLEIGINSGASLRMWEEFFPNANIIGIDIDHNFLFQTERIKSLWCDAGDAVVLRRVIVDNVENGGPFDLIIDDGSHELYHQQVAMNTLLPALAMDGLYIIEDVQDPDRLMKAVPPGYDALHYIVPDTKGRMDNIVIVAHA